MYVPPLKYADELKKTARTIARRVSSSAAFKARLIEVAARRISKAEMSYYLSLAEYEWRKIGWTQDSDGNWSRRKAHPSQGLLTKVQEVTSSQSNSGSRIRKGRSIEIGPDFKAGAPRGSSEIGLQKEDFLTPKVYVLKLEEENYYVGRCTNFPVRIKRHIEGNGSLWTKLHRPIATIAFFLGGKEVEKSVTLHYMEQFGINRVRGWVFCKGGFYNESEVAWQIARCRRPIPIAQLRMCKTLSPMLLERSPKWEINRTIRKSSQLHDLESIY